MSEVLDITIKLVEDFNNDIKADIIGKNINDTGNAIQSLRVDFDTKRQTVQSVGADYIEILNTGRAPGKFPPVQAIREWVQSKLGVSEAEANSVAYLVGRKIANEGTAIFKDKKKGLQIEDKVINLRVKLKEEIPKYAKADVLNTLRKFTKERLKNGGKNI